MKCRTTEAVGAAIKAARVYKGYTRRGLAEVAKVSDSTISRIERGKICPTIDTLFMITDALGLDCYIDVKFIKEEE